jgi:hypothetical protein
MLKSPTAPPLPVVLLIPTVIEEAEDAYIKLAEAVSMRCEENLRGRSEYPITNTDTVHSP